MFEFIRLLFHFKCKYKPKHPQHYDFNTKGEPVFYERHRCTVCGRNKFVRVPVVIILLSLVLSCVKEQPKKKYKLVHMQGWETLILTDTVLKFKVNYSYYKEVK